MTEEQRKLKQAKHNILIKITQKITENRRTFKKLKNPISDQAMRINSENQGLINSIYIIEKEMV